MRRLIVIIGLYLPNIFGGEPPCSWEKLSTEILQTPPLASPVEISRQLLNRITKTSYKEEMRNLLERSHSAKVSLGVLCSAQEKIISLVWFVAQKESSDFTQVRIQFGMTGSGTCGDVTILARTMQTVDSVPLVDKP